MADKPLGEESTTAVCLPDAREQALKTMLNVPSGATSAAPWKVPSTYRLATLPPPTKFSPLTVTLLQFAEVTLWGETLMEGGAAAETVGTAASSTAVNAPVKRVQHTRTEKIRVLTRESNVAIGSLPFSK